MAGLRISVNVSEREGKSVSVMRKKPVYVSQ